MAQPAYLFLLYTYFWADLQCNNATIWCLSSVFFAMFINKYIEGIWPNPASTELVILLDKQIAVAIPLHRLRKNCIGSSRSLDITEDESPLNDGPLTLPWRSWDEVCFWAEEMISICNGLYIWDLEKKYIVHYNQIIVSITRSVICFKWMMIPFQLKVHIYAEQQTTLSRWPPSLSQLGNWFSLVPRVGWQAELLL